MVKDYSTIKTIEALKYTIDKGPLRFLLKQLSGYCKRDNKNRLEVALEFYVGERTDACWTCTHIVVPVVRWVVEKGGKAFGVDEEGLKERFKDVYWRRGLVNVIRGIAKFGVRKPFVPGAPFLVVWNYTYLCNLRCKHCYASAGKPHPNELTTQEAKDTVRKLADIGVNIIAFSGGEPLMRKDFYDVAKLARDHGVFTAVATNATLITRDVARKLKKIGIGYVQISLDGANPETHNNFRGMPGIFEKTIRGIKNCVKEGIFVEVSTTATKFNYEEIPEIIDLCEELGVDWWMMYNFVPTGRGRFIVENDLTPEEREKLLRFLWKRLREGRRMQVLSTAPQFARVSLQMEEKHEESGEMIIPTHFYNPHLRDQLLNLSEFIGGCGAGRFYCALDPDGTVTPCVFFPLPVGNIKEDDFEDTWDNHPVFWDLRNRDKLKGHCGKCEFKYVCGGCRARAYGYFRDYLAPDPGCINNRHFWDILKGETYKCELLPKHLDAGVSM